ncbi:MAG: iron ABC transporter permease [Oscillospiraceae bacterium]|nr:iron ABC transporter permease [Oscillospiraceae bacterium]
MPIFIFFFSICVGRYDISVGDVIKSILQLLSGHDFGLSSQTFVLVTRVRIPRTLQGLFVGACLAASGTCFQSIFRNPLVSSGMLGVSSGSGFGAALSILLFGTSIFAGGFSFVFGMMAVALSYLVGKIAGGNSTITLVLGGTIIQSIFQALLSLLKYVADTETQLPAITYWLMGSFASTKSSDFLYALIPMTLGLFGMFIFRNRLNVLSMGDREARALGIDVGKNKLAVISSASLATAGAVAVSGIIGWVGLVIPHICRMLFGNDNKIIVPTSMAIGGSFMVLIDMICRTLTGSEIPLGIVTSIVGGPFFIYLLKKTKGKQW